MESKNPTMFWQPCNLYGEYEVGEGTRIGAFCDLGGKVGKNCVIQTHVSIPPKTIIEDNVFLGPGVRIANEKQMMSGILQGTTIKKGAKIGMGALIGPGLTIGENAVVGMGSVVLKDIPDNEVWVGNPARPYYAKEVKDS